MAERRSGDVLSCLYIAAHREEELYPDTSEFIRGKLLTLNMGNILEGEFRSHLGILLRAWCYLSVSNMQHFECVRATGYDVFLEKIRTTSKLHDLCTAAKYVQSTIRDC